MQMVPLKCVPSPVRHPSGGSFGRPGGRQFCLALSQYQPVGQSARFTAAGGTSRAANPTLAIANQAAGRAILRFFISLVLLSLRTRLVAVTPVRLETICHECRRRRRRIAPCQLQSCVPASSNFTQSPKTLQYSQLEASGGAYPPHE